MRVLHIIATVNPDSGGPIAGILQQQSIPYASKFSREIVSLDDPQANFLKDVPIKVHAMGSRPRLNYPWSKPLSRYGYSPKIIPWLKNNLSKYDVVIVNGLWNYATFAASMTLRARTVPYVVFTHGMLDPWFRKQYPVKHALKCFSWLVCEGPLLSNAVSVFFTTEEERILARGEFPHYRYKECVVGYGAAEPPPATIAQENAFRARMPALHGKRFILFLSRIHLKKGCDILIDAFASVANAYPDVDLVMAGPDQSGMRPALLNRAAALGVVDRIHWPGMLLGDEKWGALRASEAFILPSHQENFGVVVAEALSCGTPVLITDKVNIWREIVRDGGGLVGEDTVAGVRGLLARFLNKSHEEKAEMRMRAQETFKKNFDIVTSGVTFLDAITVASRAR